MVRIHSPKSLNHSRKVFIVRSSFHIYHVFSWCCFLFKIQLNLRKTSNFSEKLTSGLLKIKWNHLNANPQQLNFYFFIELHYLFNFSMHFFVNCYKGQRLLIANCRLSICCDHTKEVISKIPANKKNLIPPLRDKSF